MTDAAPATDERLQAMLSDYVDGTLTACAPETSPRRASPVASSRGPSASLSRSAAAVAGPEARARSPTETIRRARMAGALQPDRRGATNRRARRGRPHADRSRAAILTLPPGPAILGR